MNYVKTKEVLEKFKEILDQIRGLEPQATLVLGAGFVREEWKTLCFQKGFSLSEFAILNTRSLAESLVPESRSRVMEKQARVELLRQAFKSEELRTALPILSQNRRRVSFYEKLDQTLQNGRMNFAHATEAQVIAERLVERTGAASKREEFFLLNRYWERLLELRELWDEARLFESAVHKLSNPLIESKSLKLQSRYYRVEHSKTKPRVEWFWAEVSKRSEVVLVSSSDLIPAQARKEPILRKQSHSLEDAAHFLLDEISENLSLHGVVIQDSPEVRRTLKRVAEHRGIPLLDPRDPTLVTQSEAMKQALLDLELCSKDFPRAVVLEWLRCFHPRAKEYRKKIIESALVQGMEGYRMLPELFLSFQKIQERYPSRLTVAELQKNIVQSIQEHRLPIWVKAVIEKLFQAWESSLQQIGEHQSKKPLRFWLEQLRERLKQLNPVVDPIKNRKGLKLYRVDQCPTLLAESEMKMHFFGLKPSYFEPSESQDEWFNTRDQEVLAGEFGWLSSQDRSHQNLNSFQLWNRYRSEFWEFEYDESGNETENFDFLFSDPENHQVISLGAHPRMLSSWKGVHELPISSRALSAWKGQDETRAWPFSFVHAYGNCPFIAFSQHLLKLQDEREVEVEVAADRLGTLLHAALEEMLKQSTPEQAFETAWKKTQLTAWEKNERWFHATKAYVIEVLKRFQEDEAVYRARSQVDTLFSEKEIEVNWKGLSLKGRIDRVDEHEDGLVVIDYKTGSGHSSGQETIETGKDLQLGLYALAVRELFQKEVIGAQYVHLDAQKINRNSGFLFSEWNQGKKTDQVARPLSTARSNSKSLFAEDPAPIWAAVQGKVETLVDSIQKGQFPAKPADPLDCAQCRYRGVCGESRR